MAFAPEKGHFDAYETYRKERPKSATIINDVYGTKSIANTPSSAESAFFIMKKIHSTTGEPLPNRGRSLFENLQYIKTEPSVKVLQKTPWRQYFQDLATSDPILTGKDLSPKNRSRDKDCFTFSQTKGEINYPQLFDQLVKRVQGIWKELHIPDCDRDFYSYALLQGPYQNTAQIDEITKYIKVLHQHRRATINVLQAIARREKCVIQSVELLASARRNSSLKYVSVQEGINQRKTEILDQNQEYAREILKTLQSLQRETLRVGEQIKLWRQGLWRPQAFIYQGQNYLLKMSNDMDLLKSDSMKRILENLNIYSSINFHGVIFANEIETGSSLLSQLSVTLRESSAVASSLPLASGGVVTAPAAERTLNSEPLGSGGGGGGVGGGVVAGSGAEGAGGAGGGREEELDEVPSTTIPPEIEELNSLVRDEVTLQRALTLESKALKTRGTFIPLLRYEMSWTQQPPVDDEVTP